MNQTIHKVYKIRNKETGLFSKGGSCAQNIWTKEGKSWSNIGHVKNHINQFITYQKLKGEDYPYNNAEIVEVIINYEDCFKTDVNDMLSEIIERKKKAEEDFREKRRKWKEEQERKQLEELKKKYEDEDSNV